jgi:hypothetical protein
LFEYDHWPWVVIVLPFRWGFWRFSRLLCGSAIPIDRRWILVATRCLPLKAGRALVETLRNKGRVFARFVLDPLNLVDGFPLNSFLFLLAAISERTSMRMWTIIYTTTHGTPASTIHRPRFFLRYGASIGFLPINPVLLCVVNFCQVLDFGLQLLNLIAQFLITNGGLVDWIITLLWLL